MIPGEPSTAWFAVGPVPFESYGYVRFASRLLPDSVHDVDEHLRHLADHAPVVEVRVAEVRDALRVQAHGLRDDDRQSRCWSAGSSGITRLLPCVRWVM